MSVLRPVILCGGSGTRLWPLSRSGQPKQFMDMGGHTLFEDTLERVLSLQGSFSPLIVCNEKHRFHVAASLQKLDIGGDILLEPEGRNTAPAIALAALSAVEKGENPFLLVLPSDHVLNPVQALAGAVERACECADSGDIVTFGITPSRPETGFGYILRGACRRGTGGYAVTRFVEKPNLARAEALLAAGDCFWNSGMFLFRASSYLEELRRYAPVIHASCLDAWQRRRTDRDFVWPDRKLFLDCPSDSIDYAVMERTDRAVVVPLAVEWSDLGSWEAFYEAAASDTHGNVCLGDIVTKSTENCYLHGTHRLVATLGVSNLVVVETPDSVLVTSRDAAQDVKTLVEELRKQGRSEVDSHLREYHSWGSSEQLASGKGFRVWRIEVGSGAELCVRGHHSLARLWIVIAGMGELTLNERSVSFVKQEFVNIPPDTESLLKNTDAVPLVIIEIQSGPCLDEDDVVSSEANYGRNG